MLSQTKTAGCCKGEDKADRDSGCNGREGFVVVAAVFLCVSTYNEASFVSGDVTEGIALDLKNPLHLYRLAVAGHLGPLDDFPGAVLAQGSQFGGYGDAPVFALDGGFERLGGVIVDNTSRDKGVDLTGCWQEGCR